jgi:hypothetical protein
VGALAGAVIVLATILALMYIKKIQELHVIGLASVTGILIKLVL